MLKTIAILAPSSVPFQIGGSEKFWWGLRNALATWSGAFVELIKIPCREESYEQIIASYEMFSQLDLDHFDMLITSKYPAWMARHRNHVCYMQHTLRGLYDTYSLTGLPANLRCAPAPLADLLGLIRKPEPQRADLPAAFELCRKALKIKSLPSSLFSFPGPLIREIVHFFDRVALAKSQIKAYLAISGTVASRPDYLPPNASVKILPHPSDLTGLGAGCERPGKYFFTASRLNSSKRVRLIIDAMASMPLDIPLKIAGTGPELEMLKQRAASDQRIEFLGHVPDSNLAALYAGALAVPFAPLWEDYGLITIEAMKSGKPVITTTDSGGVCEFVRQGETGLIVEPAAPALGGAMASLGRDPDFAARMGAAAFKSVEFIDWQNNVRELLEHAESETRLNAARRTVVVAAPFAANAYGSGGPRRLYHFCRELAREFAVELVSIGGQEQLALQRREVAPYFYETTVPWQQSGLEEAARLAELTGESADDIAIMRHVTDDEVLQAELRRLGKQAVCVVLSHPWLWPAVARALPDIPLVYDAHNVEADLKQAIFGETAIAHEAEFIERDVCQAARIIFTCSQSDLEKMSVRYKLDPVRLRVLANGCDKSPALVARGDLRRRLPYSDSKLALFIGSGHKPNLDAAFKLSAMSRDIPEVEFLVAGSVSTQKALREAKHPRNFHLLGVISEKTKNVLLQAADIGLNPVCSGSGVNLKSLEYLAYSLPFVSTPVGMRGLPDGLFPAARSCQIDEFPRNIREMLDEPPSMVTMTEISSRFREEYCWENTLRCLLPEIKALALPDEEYAPHN